MPATEFYDPIDVDSQGVICAGGPFTLSDDRRKEALAVQFHFLILQGDALARGTSSCGTGDLSWSGKAEQQEGTFDYTQPAQAYGLAVLVSKGEYSSPAGDQYIPVFETIVWSKTVHFKRLDQTISS